MGTTSLAPTSHRLQNMPLMPTDSQFQIVFVAICLITFGAHINTLPIVKVMILVDIKCSYIEFKYEESNI